jgi:CHAT domain-containing protein
VSALAWPFLAGGVRGVLVSLWDVTDEPSRTFFASFYGHLKRLGDASLALREAQLDAVAADRGSQVWRSFALVGGG